MGDDWGKAMAEALAQWTTYLWFLVLAMWGGGVSYIRRLKRGKVAFSLSEMVGECAISAFAGLITAYLCKASGLGFYPASVLIAMSGYMGGSGLAILGSIVESKIKAMGIAIFGAGAFEKKDDDSGPT